MFLEKGEILHLANKKTYKVLNFVNLSMEYYYLLENVDNKKYIVVTAHMVDSELYLKETKDENLLKKLDF